MKCFTQATESNKVSSSYQGTTLRAHDDTSGNLHQLLVMVTGDCANVKI